MPLDHGKNRDHLTVLDSSLEGLAIVPDIVKGISQIIPISWSYLI